MHIFAQGVAAESRAEPKAVQPAAVRRPTEAVPSLAKRFWNGAPCSEKPDQPRYCISTKLLRRDVPKKQKSALAKGE